MAQNGAAAARKYQTSLHGAVDQPAPNASGYRCRPDCSLRREYCGW